MKWQQITVTTTTEGSDLVSSVLYDYGSDGVSIADKNGDETESLRLPIT